MYCLIKGVFFYIKKSCKSSVSPKHLLSAVMLQHHGQTAPINILISAKLLSIHLKNPARGALCVSAFTLAALEINSCEAVGLAGFHRLWCVCVLTICK